MFPSLTILPHSSSLSSLYPVYVDYYPFDYTCIERDLVGSALECCPNCSKVIDKNSCLENDKIKCFNCLKSFKPNDKYVASEQLSRFSFISREKLENTTRFINIIAFDANIDKQLFEKMKNATITAILSIPNGYPFVFVIIRGNAYYYLLSKEKTIIEFELNSEISLGTSINPTGFANTAGECDALLDYMRKLFPEDNPNGSIEKFISHLKGDDNLYIRLTYFGPNAPQLIDNNNILIDFVSYNKPKTIQVLSGYALFLPDINDEGEFLEQIRYLMEMISTHDTVFGIKIHAEITNYKIVETDFYYSGCIEHFKQSFKLHPPKLLASQSSSIFSVDTSCIRFSGKSVYKEQYYSSKIFPKSSDFVIVASRLDPHVLIPHLLRENKLSSFISKVKSEYRTICSVLPGEEFDNTFSIMPNLQWLLMAEYSPYKKVFFLSEISKACIKF